MTVAAGAPVASGCDCSAQSPQLVPVEQALDDILASVAPLSGSETCPVAEARGRVAAAAIASAVPLPRFDNSAMDGYGIHADDLGREQPLRLRLTDRVAAGRGSVTEVHPGTTVQILTGAPVPPGVAAIVPHEETQASGSDVLIAMPPAPGTNIRRAGEDVAVAQPLVGAGTRLDVRHVALLLAAGVTEIAVRPRVKVGLLSTGDELTQAGQSPDHHKIVDTNRPLLSNLLDMPDVELRDFGIVADEKNEIAARIADAAGVCDLVITTGGICGSDADHIAPAIRAVGGACRPVKLALRPGKPIGVGRIGETTILCLPGNPVSALVTAVLLARPLLRRLAGARQQPLRGIPALAADIFRHAPGRTEFVPVVVAEVDAAGRRLLKSLPRGSHRLSSLASADGFAEIAREDGDILPGGAITFHPFTVDWAI